jgi:hypothetical protein
VSVGFFYSIFSGHLETLSKFLFFIYLLNWHLSCLVNFIVFVLDLIVHTAHRILLAVLMMAPLASSHALSLYANFDPTAPTPDYSTTNQASLSGSCNGPHCQWINGYSAGFAFTAANTGAAGRAYLPFQLLSTVGGNDNIYGLTITNSTQEIVARGGFYLRQR